MADLTDREKDLFNLISVNGDFVKAFESKALTVEAFDDCLLEQLAVVRTIRNNLDWIKNHKNKFAEFFNSINIVFAAIIFEGFQEEKNVSLFLEVYPEIRDRAVQLGDSSNQRFVSIN